MTYITCYGLFGSLLFEGYKTIFSTPNVIMENLILPRVLFRFSIGILWSLPLTTRFSNQNKQESNSRTLFRLSHDLLNSSFVSQLIFAASLFLCFHYYFHDSCSAFHLLNSLKMKNLNWVHSLVHLELGSQSCSSL